MSTTTITYYYAPILGMTDPTSTEPTGRRKVDLPPLMDLADAQRDPDIVYRSFERLSRTPPAVVPRPKQSLSSKFFKSFRQSTKPPRPVWHISPSVSDTPAGSDAGSDSDSDSEVQRPRRAEPKMTLVPLDVAQARDDIRLRQEGFEMREEELAGIQALEEDAAGVAWWRMAAELN